MGFLIVDLQNRVPQLHWFLLSSSIAVPLSPRQPENTAFKNFIHPSGGGIHVPPEGGRLALILNWKGFQGMWPHIRCETGRKSGKGGTGLVCLSDKSPPGCLRILPKRFETAG